MASAAEQMASNLSWSAFGKATELRQRIWFTIGLLIVYRLGTFIPVPGIDPAQYFGRVGCSKHFAGCQLYFGRLGAQRNLGGC